MSDTANYREDPSTAGYGMETPFIPDCIQPSGCLLCFDETLENTLQVSENLESYLGINAAEAQSRTPSQILGARALSRLRRALSGRERVSSALTIQRRINGKRCHFHVLAYRCDRRVVVEMEPVSPASDRRLLPVVNDWLAQIARAQNEDHLLNIIAQGIRVLTGYERVMIYRFDEAWNARVIAENRQNDVEGVLNSFFASNSFSLPILDAFNRNPVRSVPDAGATPVGLVPTLTAELGGPLDLSKGVLRVVYSEHTEILVDNGVRAVLYIAIQAERGLWGLVACHAMSERTLSPPAREAAQTIVQMGTQRLFLLKSYADRRFRQQVLDSRELVSAQRGALKGPKELLQSYGGRWLELFRACGAALVRGERVTSLGTVPSEEGLIELCRWLLEQSSKPGPWVGKSLSETELVERCELNGCCGLLAVPLVVDQEPSWLLLFRSGAPLIRRWIGKAPDTEYPLQRVESANSGVDIWLEQLPPCSEEWTSIEKTAALDLGEDLEVAISAHAIELLNRRLFEANDQLERLAHTDLLTGVWNRYRMELAIDSEISAAKRYGRELAVLLFDIDHFKSVNDTFGHETGDRVLRTLAATVELVLRKSDYLGRWGGEEFVVLASSTGAEAAAALAERLRLAVAEQQFETVNSVTISIGGAVWRDGDTRKSLVARADEAMYHAKHQGRNAAKFETDDSSQILGVD